GTIATLSNAYAPYTTGNKEAFSRSGSGIHPHGMFAKPRASTLTTIRLKATENSRRKVHIPTARPLTLRRGGRSSATVTSGPDDSGHSPGPDWASCEGGVFITIPSLELVRCATGSTRTANILEPPCAAKNRAQRTAQGRCPLEWVVPLGTTHCCFLRHHRFVSAFRRTETDTERRVFITGLPQEGKTVGPQGREPAITGHNHPL